MPSQFTKGLISLGVKLTKPSVHLKVHCATLEAVGVGANLMLPGHILVLELVIKLEKMRRRKMQFQRSSLKIIPQVKMIKREREVKVKVKREAMEILMKKLVTITTKSDGIGAAVSP